MVQARAATLRPKTSRDSEYSRINNGASCRTGAVIVPPVNQSKPLSTIFEQADSVK